MIVKNTLKIFMNLKKDIHKIIINLLKNLQNIIQNQIFKILILLMLHKYKVY